MVAALRALVTQSPCLSSLVSSTRDSAFATPEPGVHLQIPGSNICSPVYSAISPGWQLCLSCGIWLFCNTFACHDFGGLVKITFCNDDIFSVLSFPFTLYLQVAPTIYEWDYFEKRILKKKYGRRMKKIV